VPRYSPHFGAGVYHHKDRVQNPQPVRRQNSARIAIIYSDFDALHSDELNDDVQFLPFDVLAHHAFERVKESFL
jgi:hypothetical protein